MCDLSRVVCGCSGDKAHRSNGRERVPGYSPCESHGHVRDRVWVALFDVAQVLGDCVRPGLPRGVLSGLRFGHPIKGGRSTDRRLAAPQVVAPTQESLRRAAPPCEPTGSTICRVRGSNARSRTRVGPQKGLQDRRPRRCLPGCRRDAQMATRVAGHVPLTRTDYAGGRRGCCVGTFELLRIRRR